MSDDRLHERLGERLHDALLELAYGELPPREARALERHAAGCEACRGELDRIRETRALMSGLGEEPAPRHGEQALLAAAREAASARRAARRRWPAWPAWQWRAALGVAALVAVGAVSYRLLALRPGPALREDPEALLGRAAPPPAAPAAPEAEGPLRREPSAPGPAAPQERADADARVADAGQPPPAAPPADSGRRADAARPPAAAKAAPPAAGPVGQASRSPRPSALRAPAAAAPELAPEEPARAPDADAAARARVAAPAPAPQAFRAAEAAPAPATGTLPAPEAPSAPPTARRAAAAARSEAAAAPEADPLDRWRALREAGALRGEVVTFTDCAAEAWRKVETDPEGRVVRYARHGRRADGGAFEAELYYREDGALGRVRYREDGGAWREARLPGPAGGIPAAALQPARAAEARADAPARCGF